MAGQFTHMMSIEYLLEKSSLKTHRFFDYLTQNKPFLLHGAISPDLSALSSAPIMTTEWNRRLHNDETNATPLELARLLIKHGFDQKLFPKMIAWLAGYIAHMVADAMIHPMVNLAVGDYEDNRLVHLECETKQDTYLFHKVMRRQLENFDSYFSALDGAQDGSYNIDQDLKKLWGQSLTRAYPERIARYPRDIEEAISEWNQGYWSTIRVKELITSRQVDPDSSYPVGLAAEKLDKYIRNAKTPIDGFEDIYVTFLRTTTIIDTLWGTVFEQIGARNLSKFTETVPGWNLDTGIWNNRIDLWNVSVG